MILAPALLVETRASQMESEKNDAGTGPRPRPDTPPKEGTEALRGREPSTYRPKYTRADLGASPSMGNECLIETPTEDLCQSCQRIDMDLFQLSWVSIAEPICDLQTLDNTANCPLCLFFSRLKVDHPTDAPRLQAKYRLWAISIKEAFGLRYGFSLNDSIMFAVIADTVSDIPPYKEIGSPMSVQDFAWSYNCFMPMLAEDLVRTAISIRLITGSVDYGLIKHWMNFCFTHHTESCTPVRAQELDLRLIHCTSRQIIHASALSHGTPYVTLSYVWGEHDTAAVPEKLDNLPLKLPQLIEDAIVVTTRLGYDYLWVDRYCVPQDNQEEKLSLIGRMDRVYSGSVLTIIAAACKSPNQGLPGVSGIRTPPQNCIRVKNRSLVQVLSGVATEIKNSEWNTRGWTYQEGLLSHRRLVFTASQVYFQCSGMWCIEGLSYPLRCLHHPDLQSIRDKDWYPFSQRAYTERLPRVFPRRNVGQDRDSPIFRIREYSQKRLTFEQDALDAFRGVLNHLEKSVVASIQGHLCGVLLWHCHSCLASLLYGLSWQLHPPYQLTIGDGPFPERRKMFPSWSWLGWVLSNSPRYLFDMNTHSKLDFDTGRIFTRAKSELVAGAEISIEYDSGAVIEWSAEHYEKALKPSVTTGNPRFLRVNGFVAELRIPRIGFAAETQHPTDMHQIGPYLINRRYIQRLQEIAATRGLPANGDGFSFTCWVMPGYPEYIIGNGFWRYQFMALVQISGSSVFERVDMLDVEDKLRKENERATERARRLGWKKRDIVIG